MKRLTIFAVIIIMILSLTACSSNQPTATSSLEDQYYSVAEQYVKSGDTDKAIAALEEGIANTKSEKLQKLLDEIKSKITTTVAPTTTVAVPKITDEKQNKDYDIDGYPMKHSFVKPVFSSGDPEQIKELNTYVDSVYTDLIVDDLDDDRNSYDVKYKALSYKNIGELYISNDYNYYGTSDRGTSYSIIMYDLSTGELLTNLDIVTTLSLDSNKIISTAKEKYKSNLSSDGYDGIGEYYASYNPPTTLKLLKMYLKNDSIYCIFEYQSVESIETKDVNIGKISDFTK